MSTAEKSSRRFDHEPAKNQLKIFDNVVQTGIDLASGGVSENVTVQRDFRLESRNNRPPGVEMGNGLVIDFKDLILRLEQKMGENGQLVAKSINKTGQEELEGETNACLFWKKQLPNARFPVDKITYLYTPKFDEEVDKRPDFDLEYTMKIFYFPGEDRIPVSFRFLIARKQHMPYDIFIDA